MLAINKWGKSGWCFLHAVAHTRPHELTEEEASNFEDFLRLFCLHLPCPLCSSHCQNYLKQNFDSTTMRGREEIVSFLNDLHNDVNKRTNKRTYTLREHYEFMSGKENSNSTPAQLVSKTLLSISCLLICSIVIKILYKNRKTKYENNQLGNGHQ